MTSLPSVPPLAWQHLRQWAQKSSNMPLLLTGAPEDTLAATANQLAQLLLCTNYRWPAAPEPSCGTCRSCRLCLAGNHPDLTTLTTTAATWTVKDIQRLFQATVLTPAGNRRLLVVHAIEKVSLPAANALLKSLEEPNPATSFILTTRFPRRLLATIRSRCSIIQLRNPAPAVPAPALLDSTALNAGELDEELLEKITRYLDQQLHTDGPTPALKRAYARLRDYYVISQQRGNKKLAGEVLLLSLPLENGISLR